jgi:hypothetical protein
MKFYLVIQRVDLSEQKKFDPQYKYEYKITSTTLHLFISEEFNPKNLLLPQNN